MHHGRVSKNIARGLKELRKRIHKAKIPSSKLDENLLLATWNIREFGKKARKKISLHHIAEILGQFDLIAVTEVHDNISDLAKVLRILGPYWRAVYSDSVGDHGGNQERIAYVFDKRAVAFTGLAAEADAPRKKNKKTGEYETLFSWWRKPYIASFRSGNFDFVLITAHIRWGNKKTDRIAPLKLLANWVEKMRKSKYCIDKDIIVMGDFNIPKVGDALFKAITGNGLKIPKGLLKSKFGSNLAKKKRYDQILHYAQHTKNFTNQGGILDFYAGNFSKLFPGLSLSKVKYTFQLSDHLPLWVEMNTDIDEEQLDQIVNPK